MELVSSQESTFIQPWLTDGTFRPRLLEEIKQEFLPKGSLSLILQDLCAFMTSRPRPPGPQSIFNMARSRLLAQSDFLWHENNVTLIQ